MIVTQDMLRKSYTDNVTGVTGVCTAVCFYADKPPMALLECTDTTGRPMEVWVTEARLTEPR